MRKNKNTVAIAAACVLFGAVASTVGVTQASDHHAKAADSTKGPRGPRGHRGHTGKQGDPGPVGPQGVQGPQGVPGLDGVDTNGVKGDPGPQGERGPAGANGSNGKNGVVDFTKVKYRYNEQSYGSSPGTGVSVTATCQDNERLLTGGAVAGGATLSQSNPFQGSPPDSDDGWTASAILDSSSYHYLEVIAVCVAVG